MCVGVFWNAGYGVALLGGTVLLTAIGAMVYDGRLFVAPMSVRACPRLFGVIRPWLIFVPISFLLGTIMKTFVDKPHEVKRDWFVIDARGKVLGRVASEVARRLRGQHTPAFTPQVDTGR